MADVFEDRRDLDSRREMLWNIIKETPHLDWLLLTKRPQNVPHLSLWSDRWPENVWLGATAENQRWLEKRMPPLTSSGARVLFLSCEPLLGPLDLSFWIEAANRGEHRRIDWVIAGGESGHHARPMHPEWLTSLRDQCVAAGISFHFKQWGNWSPISRLQVNDHPSKVVFLANGDRITVANVGKKAAGRRLQGRTWDEFPAMRTSDS
jgi:protein gp37